MGSRPRRQEWHNGGNSHALRIYYVCIYLPLVFTYSQQIRALADPTRRRILERLRGGPLSVTALAAGVTVTRPAVSQHLKILRVAGLVDLDRAGNRRIYRLMPDGPGPLHEYLRWLHG